MSPATGSRRPRLRGVAAGTGLAVALTATGCTAGAAALPGPATERVTVLAAASLTDALTELAGDVETRHPGLDVELSFGGSQTLVSQVRAGVPADLVVTADEASMQPLVADGLVAGPVPVATNTLVVAVERGNPERVAGIADLDRPGLRVVLAAPDVPAGRLARQALAAAGSEVRAASDREVDVRSVLAKVRVGAADAGVVYLTDVASAGGSVEAVPVDGSPVTTYPAAVVTGGDEEAARLVLTELTGEAGRRALGRQGFGPPAGSAR